VSGEETGCGLVSGIFILAWSACALLWFPSLWDFWIPGVLGGMGVFCLIGSFKQEGGASAILGIISGCLFCGVGVIIIFFWTLTPLLSSFLSVVGSALLLFSLE
jgi:hypothetical protein